MGTVTYDTFTTGDALLPFASFPLAPLLVDGSEGDTATYYERLATGGTFSPGAQVYALTDFFGLALLDRLSVTFNISHAGQVILWYFNDLAAFQAAWDIGGIAPGGSYQESVSSGAQTFEYTFPADTAARYVLVRVTGNTASVTGITNRVSDVRVFGERPDRPAPPVLQAVGELVANVPQIAVTGN